MRYAYLLVRWVFETLSVPLLFAAALVARRLTKPIDVGLGPQPLINNVYHKKALSLAGYSAETFVHQVWHITSEFDVRFDRHWLSKHVLTRVFLLKIYMFIWTIRRYRALVLYFDGGPLGQGTAFLWRIEPTLYSLAGVRTLMLPYGSDVQAMSRSPNLLFKHAMAIDYPLHRRRHLHIQAMIDRWIAGASHVVSGCEWVDYMHHWDTLMLAHFSIELPPSDMPSRDIRQGPLKLLHAPNHRAIKGTPHIQRAVEELRAEGLEIDLVLAEHLPNAAVRKLILEADVVVDQLIVGWYAMFAIEAMASGKPVICYLRPDLENLYVSTRLLTDFNEIPILRADIQSFKKLLRDIHGDRSMLAAASANGRLYVERHHSVQAVSKVFADILIRLIGLPSAPPARGA